MHSFYANLFTRLAVANALTAPNRELRVWSLITILMRVVLSQEYHDQVLRVDARIRSMLICRDAVAALGGSQSTPL